MPTSQWFIYSEDGKPIGQVYRRQPPEVGARVEEGEVVAFEELRATCSAKRFKVTVNKPSA